MRDYKPSYRNSYRRALRSAKPSRARLNRAIFAWASLAILVLLIAILGSGAIQKPGATSKMPIIRPQKESPSQKGSEDSKEPDSPSGGHKIRVKVNVLNFRSSPEMRNDNIIGQLYRGEELLVISSKGSWYEVKSSKGRRGFVTSDENYVETLNR